MSNPLVSIVIPVYNGSNYLREAIDSALAQTYKNVEIIVVNDGSNDHGATENIALSYGNKIRYFSKENGGVSSALNKGIQEMKGAYFSWLSHDDMYTPEKIQSHISVMTDQNQDHVFMCGSSFIDKDAQPLKRLSSRWPSGQLRYDQVLSFIFHGKSIGGCALLIPRALFDKYGMFKTEIKYMQDSDMWYRFLTGGVNFVSHPQDICVLSRVHGQQTTVTSKHLGRKDADFVGSEMVSRILKMSKNDTYLLKEYMYLCCRNRSHNTGRKAYTALNEKKQLSLADKIKYMCIFIYGNIRPYLVCLYYKLFFRIEVKK